jgi:hypothetical protein
LGWLQALAAEFSITLFDGTVWLSIGQAMLFGAACLLFGIWLARFVGLLPSDAPAGETLGVGLASGLVVLAAWWAAIASGGRSSFTPVAVGFVIAIGLAVIRRWRPLGEAPPPADLVTESPAAESERGGNLVVAVLGGAAFVVVVALLYGSTLMQSPREGVQPLEFNDPAYYSVLGADLVGTGTENLYSPAGFATIDGLSTQTWYHWGELWLASAVIRIFGTAPLDARHLVVLPLLVLAAAALTGTVVRRMTGSSSRSAYLFGFVAFVFLAPVPLIPGPFFSSWAGGLIFGIASYGLAAVAVMLGMYSLAVLSRRTSAWTLAAFVGSAAASILPDHIVIAVLALVGVGSVWTIRVIRSVAGTQHLPVVAPVWRVTFAATGVALAATAAWGLLTGHAVGYSPPLPDVTSFNASWRESVAITTVCSGAFLAIIPAWFLVRKDRPIEAGLYAGTSALLIAGAIAWGARLDDLDSVHLFYGGIAVFATPVASLAVVTIWLRLRIHGQRRLAVAVLVLCVAQIQFGVILGIIRLASFGPGKNAPVPVAILAEIRTLSQDAKLAYACLPSEEVAFWNARLLALDARTGRRIVPMCFQAETAGALVGGQKSADIPDRLFLRAPQAMLYPTSSARPSASRVASFLKDNGIDYIYADALHPNSLVPGAIPIATSGDTQVLRIP